MKLTLVNLHTYSYTRMMEGLQQDLCNFCLVEVKDGLTLADVHTKCKLPVKELGLQTF